MREQASRRRTLFVLSALWAALVVFTVHLGNFPGSVPDFTRASGGGTLLDAIPAFTVDEVYERLDGYGDAGRENYAFRNLSVDILLPLSVFPFAFLLARRASARFVGRTLMRASVLALPFAYVILDLVENAAVLGLLAAYPERVRLLAAGLPYVTILKRAASLLTLIVPLMLLGIRAVRTTSASPR